MSVYVCVCVCLRVVKVNVFIKLFYLWQKDLIPLRLSTLSKREFTELFSYHKNSQRGAEDNGGKEKDGDVGGREGKGDGKGDSNDGKEKDAETEWNGMRVKGKEDGWI